MNVKRVNISTNGCLRRKLDAERLANYFRSNKCKIVMAPWEADYIIFVTCSFKKSKEEECWRSIERYEKYKGELIVLGCLPEIAPVVFHQKVQGRYLSTKNLSEIDQLFSDFKTKFKDIPDVSSIWTASRRSFLSAACQKLFVMGITRKYFNAKIRQIKNYLMEIPCKGFSFRGAAYLRVSNGCPEQCAYCCIYRAVGGLKSKTIQDCVDEYKSLLQKKQHMISILADNLGAYGLDIKSSFPELLRSFSAISNNEIHWEIQEFHPRWIVRYKTELLKYVEEKRILRIGVPVQSGSNRILRMMNRHHGIEEIKGILLEFRRANPGLVITTQIIIGFPSETEEDFHDTLNAIKEIRFDAVTIFPYYDGYNTMASKMDGKIDQTTISRRIKEGLVFLEQAGIPAGCDDDLESVSKVDYRA